MKLQEHLSKLPKLYSTDGVKGDLPAVYVFQPDGAATWALWEYSSDTNEAFGLCDLGMGFPEIGYVSVEELESILGPLRLPVEVDAGISTRFAGYKSAGVPIPSFLQ